MGTKQGTPNVVRGTAEMIAGMRPRLDPGEFVFCTVQDTAATASLLARSVSTAREREGVSLVLERPVAEATGFDASLAMRRITLDVHSALDGVGLTAAVAAALATQGIACNMVSAYHHDYVFVPSATADRALAILLRLQSAAPSA